MSNPEKTRMEAEEEINENSDESEYLWSDEEGDVRELVLALPAMSISERLNLQDQAIREKATVAAQLVMSAAEEAAVTKGKPDETVGGSGGTKKKLGRPKKVKFDVVVSADGASGSVDGGESVKKPKKKGSTQLTNPPQGPPKCNICGRDFVSWKAVFGHLRSHKDRGYQGFLPPPTFNAAEEGFGGAVAASSGSGGFGLGTGGLEIDLNVDPMENEEGNESGSTTPKFDLNKSPPHEDEEEKEDKAE